MNIVRIRMTFAVALVLVVTATGLWAAGAEEDATAADKKYVTDPVTGKVYTAPEYGGTMHYARKADYGYSDNYIHGRAAMMTSPVVEKLGTIDWAIDRDIYPFVGGYMAPLFALKGALAESWEQTDGTTYVFNIRKGVHWQDKAPMNGRELTAKDVEHSFHRFLGLGSGFTEPSPLASELGKLPWESIEATDKYTVVMKLTKNTQRTACPILTSTSCLLPRTCQQFWRHCERVRSITCSGVSEPYLGRQQYVYTAPRGNRAIRRHFRLEEPGGHRSLYDN